MRSFYWLVEGVLAGCGRPGQARAAADSPEAMAALDRDLGWLRDRGIGAVLSLTETALTDGALARYGLAGLHLPVEDMRAPAPEQFGRALAFIDQQRALGRRVVVHCLVGQGRTGTILAAYLIRGGLDAAAAVAAVRAVCPFAIESPEQRRALAEYAAGRAWVV